MLPVGPKAPAQGAPPGQAELVEGAEGLRPPPSGRPMRPPGFGSARSCTDMAAVEGREAVGDCSAKRTEVCCGGGGWRGEEEVAAAAAGSWGSSEGWRGGRAGCGVRGGCCVEVDSRRGGVETERRAPGEGEW